MKRFAFVLSLAFVLAVAGMASAEYNPEGEPLPPGADEVETFRFVALNGSWIPTGLAKSWNSGVFQGRCNMECHEAELVTHVSVAQWLEFEVDGTRKDWRVLKPGMYASASSARVKSNNDVSVSFYLRDPEYLNPDPDADSAPIQVSFNHGPGDVNNPNDLVSRWKQANDEDDPYAFTIAYEDAYKGTTFNIWQRITVEDHHRSSEYEGTGMIEICVTNLKFWVDGNTGEFTDPQE